MDAQQLLFPPPLVSVRTATFSIEFKSFSSAALNFGGTDSGCVSPFNGNVFFLVFFSIDFFRLASAVKGNQLVLVLPCQSSQEAVLDIFLLLESRCNKHEQS